MSTHWKKGYDLEKVVNVLKAMNAGPDEERGAFGSQEFPDVTLYGVFEAHDCISTLVSALEIEQPMTQLDKRLIVVRSVFKSASIKSLNQKTILEFIKKYEREYSNKPIVDFDLWTTHNIEHGPHLRRMNIYGLTSHFKKGTTKISADVKIFGRYYHKEIPRFHSSIKTKTRGRSVFEAANLAADSIDLWRGIWCFALNYKSRRSGGSAPGNKILIGPFYLLCNSVDSTQILNVYENRTYYKPSDYTVALQDDWAYVRLYEDVFRRKLRLHPNRSFVEQAIIRYVRALDHVDYAVSLVKLWGLLETLTSFGDPKVTYDDSIRRTAFLYRNSAFHVQVLKSLSDARNQTVHAGIDPEDDEAFMYKLAGYVKKLIRFHLIEVPKLADFNEVRRILDGSTDVEILLKRVETAKKALKIRKIIEGALPINNK